jgi:hypothetical protein
MINFNGFIYHKLDELKSDITLIPSNYGIYKWVHWPEFDFQSITPNELCDLLLNFSKVDFQFEENLIGKYKFKATIAEQGFKDNSNIFGLSDEKHLEIKSFLQDRNSITFFSEFFKEVCFARPFYLGKANNLQGRLKDHIKGRSNILKEIISQSVKESDIWVGYKNIPLIPQTTITNINNILEEIYTRRLKPGLSIKPN